MTLLLFGGGFPNFDAQVCSILAMLLYVYLYATNIGEINYYYIRDDRLQIYRLEIIDQKIEIKDYRLAIIDQRLQISDYGLEIIDYRLQIRYQR